MERRKSMIKAAVNLVLFLLFLYLIIAGQRNSGPVEYLAAALHTDAIRPVGIGIMLFAVTGLLIQLNHYNRRYR
jgi:uncharacterized integral membrane protein